MDIGPLRSPRHPFEYRHLPQGSSALGRRIDPGILRQQSTLPQLPADVPLLFDLQYNFADAGPSPA